MYNIPMACIYHVHSRHFLFIQPKCVILEKEVLAVWASVVMRMVTGNMLLL
jgi:hypothetical protein